jgi:asparagine synthase (glutamine-hydrolysing)
MVEVMRREPFYSAGSLQEPRLGLGCGWVVHKQSFCDCNPIWNETRDICAIVFGEDFNDPSEIDQLRHKGHVFGEADASYIVHWYEELGPAFLRKLNGSTSGIVIDKRLRQAILFNDRYGLGRIYTHDTPDGFYFSSEAKSLLRILPAVRAIDPTGLAEFCSCGCALANRTLFRGIAIMPPAAQWTFLNGQLTRRETYFDRREWENRPQLSASEFTDRLGDVFPRLLPTYLRGAQSIGMSLTGGIDGRMIMACASAEPKALPCYTFGSDYRDCADVVLARRVAELCGQKHETINVGEKFIDQFAALADQSIYFSDGAMDVTGSVELYCNRIAREIAPVRLTGNYGSEILRRNVAFRPTPLSHRLFSPEFRRLGVEAEGVYREESNVNRLSFIAFKQVSWHHYSRLSIEQSQLSMRTPYLDNSLVALAYQAPSLREANREAMLKVIADQNKSLARIPTDRGLLYHPKLIITRLNNLYQELSFRAEYVYDYGMPPWLAIIDNALRALQIERLFLGRHKFYHFRVWYRDKLSRYLKDILLDRRTKSRDYLLGSSLESLVREHVAGARNHTTELHRAISIELIYRQLIERRW